MTDSPRNSPSGDRWGVLLLAHGAPDRLDDIPEFLLNVRGGRPLPPPVVEEIKRRYALIGGGSPLLRLTREQATALAQRLSWPVYVGMRNWRPFIAQAVREVVDAGLERMVAICLAPQNSRTSVGLYRSHLEAALAEADADVQVHFVESWHDNPFLVRAFAEKLRATVEEAESAVETEVTVILTAHSVPEKTIAGGDPYDAQVRATRELVAAAAGCRRWRPAYQSQGLTSGPWLGPTVESILDELAAAGERHVVVAPVGFVSDHVEVLYDIDIGFRQYAAGKGITLWRPDSLNASPLLIEALASVAEAAILSSAAPA